MELRDRFDFIRNKAKLFGAEGVGFLPAESLNRLAAGGAAIESAWLRARTVIVLAIWTLGNSEEIKVTEDSILNSMAYKLAVWLSEKHIASVYMPRGDSVTRLFPHDLAAKEAKSDTIRDDRFKTVSVLSSFDFGS
ncbi:MAG: hypothetical protein LBU13_10070 [Synergistaceae bacterium]|jgi:hypothetical protein|nr:hypothetical protein [Synergistaceae bacterium]